MVGSFSTSVAVNLVSKLGEYLFAPIGRQFGYVLCYKSYVNDLENGVEELETARKRVQSSVDEAVYGGKPIHTDVENWLKSVKEETDKAVNILKSGASAKNACFRGCLPNPMVRYPIGRKVKKMTPLIRELREESRNSNFQKVYHENPPMGLVTATTSTARPVDDKGDDLEYWAKIMDDVMKALVDDKFRVIGVYGPGGVGKSKLLDDIKRRVQEEKLFRWVARANVTCNPDLKRIQGEIADAINMKPMNEETALGRAPRLCERLEKLANDPKEKVLIILDDLWDKLELKEVGIPCGDDNKIRGCKLLLTSRKLDVLRTHMGSDEAFQLNLLDHGDARRLFEQVAGDRVNNPEFGPWVDGAVRNCGGLPLSIVSLAKILKHKDLAAWMNASTNKDLSNVKSLVQLSYNDIKEERIKSLFLICVLSSGTVFTRDSLVYCMGLDFFKEFSEAIQKARYQLIVDLQTLQDSSLLLDNDGDELFRMHDLFAEAAISIATTEWNALVGRKGDVFKKWSEDELRNCTAISLDRVGIEELPEKLDCPNLKILLLAEYNPSLKIPQSFFESMKMLQVLDITGLSFTSLPLSIELLGGLKSLCLDQCHLEDVTVLGKLKGLQFLSFIYSTISRLPKEIGGLTELRFLDLTGCTRLKVIEPDVLRSLVNLEELYMEDSFDQWEAEEGASRRNASLAELKNMKNLSTLSIVIPHSTNLPRYLPFGKLNNYKIQIGEVWDWSGEYKESRTLKLKLESGNLLEEWLSICLLKTQDLHLDGLRDDTDSIHDLCIEGFQELKHLHVQNSPSFRYVVRSIENIQCTAFTRLESLFLENLNNLEKLCHGYLAVKSFSELKIVKVENCGEIKHLFPLCMKRIISQVEDIEISRCHQMHQIVANAEANEDGDEIDDNTKEKSCNLRSLTLRNLPEMTNFCKTVHHSVNFFDGQQIVKLQKLEAITIEGCQLIQGIFDLEGLATSGEVEILSRLRELTLSDLPSLGHIWTKNPRRTLCFQNLRTLKVQNCEKLRFLFSSSTAKALGQIKEIEIARCKLMEEIIEVQEEESKEATITNTLEFPLLTSLSLEGLPNLGTFSYGKYHIHYPSLTRLKISGCPKMKTFCSFEGKQQSMITDTGLQQSFGHINSGLSLPIFFNEKVHFPSLEELELSSIYKLKRIWPNQLHRQSFRKLASLTIELCENLLHVFPSNSMDWLQSLNKLKVVGCPSLEELFEPVSLNVEKRQKPLVLSALKEVKLLNLPRLRDILKSDCKQTLAFPSLIKVNVRRCHSLPYLFSTATVKTLEKLEVLDVSYCNNLRSIIVMEEGKGKIMETLKFHHLSTLKLGDLDNLISFSSTSCAGEGLHPLFDEKLTFPKLEELQIKGIRLKELWYDKILAKSFGRLKVLEVKQCHNLLNVIPSFMWKRLFHCIESLTVESCNLIESIHTFEGLGVMEREATRNSPLRKLSLRDLPNLTCIWKNEDLSNLYFHNLTSIRVEECPSLRILFTMNMAKSLGQLQHLVLGSCGEMEHVVAGEEETPIEAVDIIVISQLVTLYLHNMPKLKSFYQGKHISEWPSLKEFTVEDCKAVEVILGDASCRRPEGSIPTQQSLLLVKKVEFPSMEFMKISHMDNAEKIWFGELASNAFTKLKTLVVEYCEKLPSIFSSHTILTRFQNLEKLTVTDCKYLEVVFHVVEFNFSEAHSTSIFQLRELVLTRLPNMKHLWSGLSQGGLTFGCLRSMNVMKCESLKSLFPCSVAKSMTQLEELLVLDCGVEEIIVEEDGVGMNASDLFFPQLTNLRLFGLPKLRRFYRNSHTSTWPLLKVLRVGQCGKMRSFSFNCEFQSYQGTTTSGNQPALFSFEKVIPRLEILTLSREDVMMMPQHFIFGNLGDLVLSCYHDENDAFPSNFLLHKFPNLEELRVTCSSFEEIFPEDASRHGGATLHGGPTDVERPLKELGNLKRLDLSMLCNLRRVWKDGSLMAKILKQIETLWVMECPSLLIMLPSATSFQRLIHLGVADCNGLVHLGTCSAVRSLVHLTMLILRDCGAMEDVVTDDGNGAEEIFFPKLEALILDGLPRLENFSLTDCAFRFPSLERVVITRCPKMNIFCKGALRTPNLDKLHLSKGDDEWRWEGDLNTTIQTLST